MKEKIHPQYFPDAQIVCACGNTITTGSTRKVIKVELCSKCHPFMTGERRVMDTAGRVERFRRRYEKKEQPKEQAK
jgi:large subunit ribosomal protein L31